MKVGFGVSNSSAPCADCQRAAWRSGATTIACARHVEAFEVVAAVAGIVEAAVAIGLDQRRAFALGREIVQAVGRVHGVEHAEMRGDRVGEFARRAGGQNDAAAGVALLAQPFDQLFAIGKTGGIDVDAGGDLLLQPRRTRHQPDRHQEQIERVPAQQQEQPFPQKVGRNQRAVEIDSERDCVLFRPRVHVSVLTVMLRRMSRRCRGVVDARRIAGNRRWRVKRPGSASLAAGLSAVSLNEA